MVSDKEWLKALSQLAGALTSAQVREFDPDDWDEALEWLRGGADVA